MKTVVMCVRATCRHAVLFKRSLAGCSIEIRRGGVGLADRLALFLSLSPTAVHHDPTKKGEKGTRSSSSAQTGEGVQNARPEWAAGWQYRDDAKVEAACRSGDQCRVLSLLPEPEPEPEPWTRGGGGGGWLSRRPALIGSIVATDQPPMLCDGHKRCLCATSLHLSHPPLPVSNMARLSGRQQLLRNGAPRPCLGSSVCGFCFGPWPDPLRRSSLTPSLPREQETETHQVMVEGWCHKRVTTAGWGEWTEGAAGRQAWGRGRQSF